MNSSKLLFIAFAVILVSAGSLYLNHQKNDATQCPESYKTNKERNGAYSKWVSGIVKIHPNWTVPEFAQARIDFLVQNKCSQTLKYIEEHGGMTAYKNNIIESITSEGGN